MKSVEEKIKSLEKQDRVAKWLIRIHLIILCLVCLFLGSWLFAGIFGVIAGIQFGGLNWLWTIIIKKYEKKLRAEKKHHLKT